MRSARLEMGEMENIVDYVSKNLLQRRNIKVQEEWLEACIQWLNDENEEGVDISADRYVQLVFEQWLMSNLEDIGSPSLPTETNGSCKLTGNFMLQVNYAYDIGVSAYSQLHKIDKRENEIHKEKSIAQNRSDLDGEQGKQGSRMLYFELTDGFQRINAIEYRSIPSIKAEVAPGCKIELKGPLMFKNGLLLLSSANVLVLNGACEELAEQYSSRTILAAALNVCREKGVTGNAFVDALPSKADTDAVKHEDRFASTNEDDNSSMTSKIDVSLRREENRKDAASIEKEEGGIEELFQDDLSFEDDCSFQFEDDFERSQNCINFDEFENLEFDNEIDMQTFPINQNQKNSEQEHFIKSDLIQEKEKSDDGEIPRIWLSDVKSIKNVAKFTSKCYIVTLLSKLETYNCKYHLDVYIDDGSAVLRGSISNQILEKMIGYHASEISFYREKSMILPVELKEAIIRCQQKLATFTWNMTIIADNDGKLNICRMDQWDAS